MRQRGFTLVELLVALAIGSVVLTGTLLTIHQVVLGTIRARSQTVALNDVNLAAAHIKEDIMMAQSTSLTDEDLIPQRSLTLMWFDYTLFTGVSQTLHTCTYTLSGTELLRTYDGTASIVGRNITSIGFTQSGKVVTSNITATGTSIQERSRTLSFGVRMRSDTVWQ